MKHVKKKELRALIRKIIQEVKKQLEEEK